MLVLMFGLTSCGSCSISSSDAMSECIEKLMDGGGADYESAKEACKYARDQRGYRRLAQSLLI